MMTARCCAALLRMGALLLVLAACQKLETVDTGSLVGKAAFPSSPQVADVVRPGTDLSEAALAASWQPQTTSILQCTGFGQANIAFAVSGSDFPTITTGTFSATSNHIDGTITDIPPGTGRTLKVTSTDAAAKALCSGSKSDITIVGGATTDVGIIDLVPACGAATNSGGAGVTTTVHDVGKSKGTFTFTYDAFSIPDRFQVSYEGASLLDTGSISGGGSRNLTINGTHTTITVVVTGSSSGTAWTYTVGCAN